MTLDFSNIIACAVTLFAAVGFYGGLSRPMRYGRHDDNVQRRGFYQRRIDLRLAWVLMEAPSFVAYLLVYLFFRSSDSAAVHILSGVWLLHYFHRSFVYPLRMQTRPGVRQQLLFVFLGGMCNTLVGLSVAYSVCATLPHLTDAWLGDPRFAVGMALFGAGFALNKLADGHLIAARRARPGAYVIPHGVAFRYVSCPNYLGEIVQWCGFALAAWSFPALAFALLTAANLGVRALSHHRWYVKTFPDYPAGRTALIPGLL